MKFFVYSFREVLSSSRIIESIDEISSAIRAFDREAMMVFVVVPVIHLEAVLAGVDRRSVKVGVQNVSLNDITGETTLPQLQKLGVDLITVGAMDRRELLGETNRITARKHSEILRNGFKSMLHVGETVAERESGSADKVIAAQVAEGFENIPEDAYYRTGVVYQPSQASEQGGGLSLDHTILEKRIACIRTALKNTLPQAPEPLPVFVSGGIKAEEAQAYLVSDLLDGIFIEDVSWKPETFTELIKSTMKLLEK